MFLKIIEYIFLTAIPAICTYLSNDDTLFKYLVKQHVLSEKFNYTSAQHICALVGILFTIGILLPQMSKIQYRYKRKNEQTKGLCKLVKDIFTATIASVFSVKNMQFNMRIFLPERPKLYRIKKKLDKEAPLMFKNNNIEPFAERDKTEELRFQVYPKPEGIVGNCYKSKSIAYDEDLEKTNSTNYNLNEAQISRTLDLKWSVCVPIVSSNNNEVVAIIAFDSTKTRLNISKKEKDFFKLLTSLSMQLYECAPELFR